MVWCYNKKNRPIVNGLTQMINSKSPQINIHTLKKAKSSVQNCHTPITNEAEASRLVGVGPIMARIILGFIPEDYETEKQEIISKSSNNNEKKRSRKENTEEQEGTPTKKQVGRKSKVQKNQQQQQEEQQDEDENKQEKEENTQEKKQQKANVNLRQEVLKKQNLEKKNEIVQPINKKIEKEKIEKTEDIEKEVTKKADEGPIGGKFEQLIMAGSEHEWDEAIAEGIGNSDMSKDISTETPEMEK
eukprot:c22144_g1_i1.p1 GENE.c22144_g1_i1~~c22144_g1_i1.p1  ORF type:complete len:245 (-),score=132.88 c22144_g1_i1:36-770(-)